jgi:predicted RNase H-like HicB family nuclease
MRYAIIIEKAKRNYAAYVPDLLGCVATGKTAAEARRQMAGAIALHLRGLRSDGLIVPPPRRRIRQVTLKRSRRSLR